MRDQASKAVSEKKTASHDPESSQLSSEWMEDIVGREWEVHWRPRDADYDADWYDATILGYSNGKMEVSFVGEEPRTHLMELVPSQVRRRGTKSVNRGRQATPEWAANWVGKQCEVFWGGVEDDEKEKKGDSNLHDSSHVSRAIGMDISTNETCPNDPMHGDDTSGCEQTIEDSDDKVEDSGGMDTVGWYYARIRSYDAVEKQFQVVFAGDKEVYSMALDPQTVRPSNRAWARRTRALLVLPPEVYDEEDEEEDLENLVVIGKNGDLSFDEWLKCLPSDTSMRTQDSEALEGIRKKISEYKKLAPLLPDSLLKFPLPGSVDLERILQLWEMVQCQRQLATRLASDVDEDDGEGFSRKRRRSKRKPAESLERDLSRIEVACKWYLSAWEFHARMMDPNSSQLQCISRTDIMDQIISGHHALKTLSGNGPLSEAPKRQSQARNSIHHRRKRRKKQFDDDDGADELAFFKELESVETVQVVVDKVLIDDQRWYTTLVASMWKSLSINFMEPIVQWELRTSSCLGIAEPAKDETDIERFSYEDIQSMVAAVHEKPILCRVSLPRDVVSLLEQKMEEIVAFESQAWPVVESILDEPGGTVEREQDGTRACLRDMLARVSLAGCAMFNMKTLGGPGSTLSKTVLKNALSLRDWFLDFQYAETSRERVSLVEKVVSRLSTLPKIPKRPNFLVDIQKKLLELEPRVRALMSSYHTDDIYRYELQLQDFSGLGVASAERKGLIVECEVSQRLHDIKEQVRFVSTAEEMLSVRLDVIRCDIRAQTVFDHSTPSFSELNELFLELEAIASGSSSTRKELVASLRPSADADMTVKEFAGNDLRRFLGGRFEKTRRLFSNAKSWKERAEAVFSTIALHMAQRKGQKNQKSPVYVHIANVEDLVQQYDALEVDLSDVRNKLKHILTMAKTWSSSIYNLIEDEATSFSDCHRTLVTRIREMPVGIDLNPGVQEMGQLDDLLRWYIHTQEATKTGAAHEVFDPLIAQGIEIVQLYSTTKNTSGAFLVPPNTTTAFLSNITAGTAIATIRVDELRSIPTCQIILERMISASREEIEGHPLSAILHHTWIAYVAFFLRQLHVASVPVAERSLSSAKLLLAREPRLPAMLVGEDESDCIISLREHIAASEIIEKQACDALSKTRAIVRVFSTNIEAVRQHHKKLKDMLSVFRGRSVEAKGVVVDLDVEQKLEQDVKLTSWVVCARSLFLHCK